MNTYNNPKAVTHDSLKDGFITYTLPNRPNIYWRIKIAVSNFFTTPRSKVKYPKYKGSKS